MNIYEAARQAWDRNLCLRKRDRTDEWCLQVCPGKVFRDKDYNLVELDARDCMGNDWYLVDDAGNEVKLDD